AVREFVLQSVDELHVADRAGYLLHLCRDAVALLTAEADGPWREVRDAHALLEFFGLLRQEVAPDVRGARAFRAAHDGDVDVRQSHARVDRSDGGMIPLQDLAKVDVGKDFA